MSDLLRVGVVGIGFARHAHVPAFRGDGRCRVVGICASSRERAQRVADDIAIPRVFGSWEELVASDDVDVVSIAVPPDAQPAIVLAAAARGKHVLCEKPVSLGLADAQAMVAAATRAGIVHAVDFSLPEIPAWRRAHTLVAEGAIGRMRSVAIAWHVQTRASSPGVISWKNDPRHGGGALNGFASHALHALEWLAGPATRVLARMAPSSTTEADRRVDALFDLASGATASLSIATDATIGTGHRIEVYGDDGALVLENQSRDYARNFTLSFGTRASDRLAPVDAGDFDPSDADGRIAAVRELVRRFVDAIVMKGSVAPNLWHGARAQLLIDGIRDSSQTAGWQSVGPR